MTLFKEKIIIAFCLITLFQACSDKNSNVDSFYTEKGGWDYGRIPLLKPYEAIIDNKNLGWSLGLNGEDGDTGFGNIKLVNVVDSVILIYSTNSILHGVDVKQSWHIIIPSNKVEKGFDSHQKYLDYLKLLGITHEPPLHDIEAISEYFDKYDIIDWNKIE